MNNYSPNKKLAFRGLAEVSFMCAILLAAPLVAFADKGGIPHRYGHQSPPCYGPGEQHRYGFDKHPRFERERHISYVVPGRKPYPQFDRPPRDFWGFPPSSEFSNGLNYGIRSGRISYREEAELRSRLEELRDQERRYLRDGYLTPYEREDLRDDRADFEKRLNHELADGEKRYY